MPSKTPRTRASRAPDPRPAPEPALPDEGREAVAVADAPEVAERIAFALAAMHDDAAHAEPEPDDGSHIEERIRTVRDLRARGEGAVELLLFRLGTELFAFDLVAAEEVVELEAVHGVPDAPPSMLGVLDLRGRLVPVYTPSAALRAPRQAEGGVMLLMRAGDRRIGVAVDDVEDVVELSHPMLRPPPALEADGGLVVGVAFVGDALVTILDAPTLVAACASLPHAEAA